jgi:hypothetical protein
VLTVLGGQKADMVSTKTPNPIDKHVGSRLRMRRMMLGMSQERLALAFGLTASPAPSRVLDCPA